MTESIENEFYIKLGKITHHQSKIEYSISNWIIKLIDNDDLIGLIITSEMSFRNLMNCLCAIINLKNNSDGLYDDKKKYLETNKDKINRLINELKILEQERNILIHSTYEFFDGFITRKKITAKEKGLTEKQELIDVKKLENIIERQVDANSNITRATWEKPILF